MPAYNRRTPGTRPSSGRLKKATRLAALVLFVAAVVFTASTWPGLLAAVAPLNAQAAPLTYPARLPSGFKSQMFASGLPTPRLMAFSPDGDLYVANFDSGNIAVLPDRNHDGQADSVSAFATGFASPNGVAFRNGSLYVGEVNRIWRLTDTNGDNVADARAVVAGNLPSNGRHRTKTVGFGPDGKLYINVGSFNDDAPESAGRATIWQFDADGSGGRVFAAGLRNTVGFDWDPTTGQMWGTDNGADDLGSDRPPDELNMIVDGGNYGFPFCTGDRQPNPKVPGGNCASTIPPAATFPPHSAPLGMAFYTGWSFPEQYWGGVFVAQHSIQYPRNRAVVFVPFKDGKPSGAPQTFFSDGQTVVGLAVDPFDGSLFVSEDRAGAIYKLSYSGPAPAPGGVSGPPPPSDQGKPAPQPATVLPGAQRCFSQTGKCLRGAFLNYWFRHGNLAQFGLPVTGELLEKLADGNTYTVQYTERARFEWHPENRGKEAQVLLGRLGADLAAPRQNEQPFKPVAPCGNCGQVYFRQTGHSLSKDLQAYWQRNGGIPVFGYPLSEGFDEKSPTDGKTYLVQYFERNRLEYHPENKGTQYEVLLGLLGVQSYQTRYGARP